MESFQLGKTEFTLPEDFQETERTEESISSPIPEADPVIEHFVSFNAPSGNQIFFYYWIGYPPRDLGPMVETESWETEIADKPGKISRTTTFMGTEQQVLVAHGEFSDNERLMVYSPNLGLEEFNKILKGLIASSEAQNFYCDKTLNEIKKILSEVGPYQWEVWDSHWYGDHLRANNEGSLKIKIYEPPDEAGPPFTLQIQGNATNDLQAELAENRKKWYEALGVTKTEKGKIFD